MLQDSKVQLLWYEFYNTFTVIVTFNLIKNLNKNILKKKEIKFFLDSAA